MLPTSGAARDPAAAVREARVDYRTLYYRWESEQWETGPLALRSERDRWESVSADDRDRGLRVAHLGLVAAVGATTALVPFCDTAPDEEQQVFLTTQLVDVARHVVFFEDVIAAIAGEGTDLGAAARAAEAALPPEARALFERLREVAVRLTAAYGAPGAPPSLIEGVTIQHVALQGAVLAQAYAALLDAPDAYPSAFVKGLSAVRRDNERHVAFGERFLTDVVEADPSAGQTIRAAAGSVSDAVVAALGHAGIALTEAEAALTRSLAAAGIGRRRGSRVAKE